MPTPKLQIGIIGIGKFGFALGKALLEKGHEVLGIDTNLEKIERASEVLTQVFQADATNKQALMQLGIDQLDHIVICPGKSIESSLIIALYLRELNAKVLWAKAVNEDHQKLLALVGVEHVINPEKYAAGFVANILD